MIGRGHLARAERQRQAEDQAHRPQIFNIEGKCEKCKTSTFKTEEAHDVGGMSEGEIWDLTQHEAEKRGWTVRKGPPERGAKRYLVCPTCVEREDKARTLQPFKIKQACAKCGNRKLNVLWCGGVDRMTVYTKPDREWLTFTCTRCGYLWRTECRDADKKPDDKTDHPGSDRAGKEEQG